MNPIMAIAFFQTLGYGLVFVVVVLGLIWLVNRRAAKDIFLSGRAQVGKLGSAARSADAKAVWEQEIRDAQEELNHSISDLEESKGLVTELDDQVSQSTREVALLDSKVRASLADDADDSSGKAASYVMQLETAKTNLSKNQEQLQKAKALYANNLKKFQYAQKKIKDKEATGRQLGQEVKSSEVNARLAKLAQKFNVDVGGLDNRLSEAEAEMRKQVARNNAVHEVQMDLGISGLAEAEEEERLAKAQAKEKLEEYRKKMGLGK